LPAGLEQKAAPTRQNGPMNTIDEMATLHLLSPDQHAEISAWITQARTPEEIMKMPAPLWRALELASVLMDFDGPLQQPPSFVP
jgi:hypothetical protein